MRLTLISAWNSFFQTSREITRITRNRNPPHGHEIREILIWMKMAHSIFQLIPRCDIVIFSVLFILYCCDDFIIEFLRWKLQGSVCIYVCPSNTIYTDWLLGATSCHFVVFRHFVLKPLTKWGWGRMRLVYYHDLMKFVEKKE